MPAIPPPAGAINQQVTQSAQAATTQANVRQMMGEVLQWNPDLPPPMALKFLNNALRSIVDRRLWYGLLVRGEVQVPQVVNLGTVSCTLGSTTVVGVGTNFDGTMVNRQFRTGFSTGWKNIKSVTDATHLELDMPWGNASASGSGYQIIQTWVSLGRNIKRVLEMVNQRQGYRLVGPYPQAAVNAYDVWRTTTGWTWMIASMPPSADGQPMWELYPSPTFQQAFPFMGYVQPADLAADTDFVPAFIRTDVLIREAIKDALLFRGRASKYYDPNTAALKHGEFEREVVQMSLNDDNFYLKDLLWNFSQYPYSQQGSLFMQSHAGSSDEY